MRALHRFIIKSDRYYIYEFRLCCFDGAPQNACAFKLRDILPWPGSNEYPLCSAANFRRIVTDTGYPSSGSAWVPTYGINFSHTPEPEPFSQNKAWAQSLFPYILHKTNDTRVCQAFAPLSTKSSTDKLSLIPRHHSGLSTKMNPAWISFAMNCTRCILGAVISHLMPIKRYITKRIPWQMVPQHYWLYQR